MISYTVYSPTILIALANVVHDCCCSLFYAILDYIYWSTDIVEGIEGYNIPKIVTKT